MDEKGKENYLPQSRLLRTGLLHLKARRSVEAGKQQAKGVLLFTLCSYMARKNI